MARFNSVEGSSCRTNLCTEWKLTIHNVFLPVNSVSDHLQSICKNDILKANYFSNVHRPMEVTWRHVYRSITSSIHRMSQRSFSKSVHDPLKSSSDRWTMTCVDSSFYSLFHQTLFCSSSQKESCLSNWNAFIRLQPCNFQRGDKPTRVFLHLQIRLTNCPTNLHFRVQLWGPSIYFVRQKWVSQQLAQS